MIGAVVPSKWLVAIFFACAFVACKRTPPTPSPAANSSGSSAPAAASISITASAAPSASESASVVASASITTAPSTSASSLVGKKPKGKPKKLPSFDPGPAPPLGARRKTKFSFAAVAPANAFDEKELRRLLHRSSRSFRFCVGGDPTLTGTVIADVSIDASGGATSVTNEGGTIADPAVRACVSAALQDVEWPPPSGDVDASLRVTIELQ